MKRTPDEAYRFLVETDHTFKLLADACSPDMEGMSSLQRLRYLERRIDLMVAHLMQRRIARTPQGDQH